MIKNCKIYNAPNTIYYKSAERIWNFGEKAIERERDNILTEEDIKKAAEEDAQLNRLGGSSTQESKVNKCLKERFITLLEIDNDIIYYLTGFPYSKQQF